MSLLAEASLVHARERCAVLGCPTPASELIEIQLPAAWEASERYTVLTAALRACSEHARELTRRADDVIAARADLHSLLAIAEAAVPSEGELRVRAEVAEAMLGLESDRAEAAERSLRLVEERLPADLEDLVRTARSRTGLDHAGALRWQLENELAAGSSADIALKRVRQLASSTLPAAGGDRP